MSRVNFPRITRPIHYTEISSHSQWLQWVDLQPATTEALPTIDTGHDGTFFCCSGHCVKYCGHWTDGVFCWPQELLRKQWT